MTVTKEELQERAQLVRALEATCKIEYPTRDELNFRLAVMKRVGLGFSLKEMQRFEIAGPVTDTPQRPGAKSAQRPGREQ